MHQTEVLFRRCQSVIVTIPGHNQSLLCETIFDNLGSMEDATFCILRCAIVFSEADSLYMAITLCEIICICGMRRFQMFLQVYIFWLYFEGWNVFEHYVEHLFLVCIYYLRPSQQFFSHFRTTSAKQRIKCLATKSSDSGESRSSDPSISTLLVPRRVFILEGAELDEITLSVNVLFRKGLVHLGMLVNIHRGGGGGAAYCDFAVNR